MRKRSVSTRIFGAFGVAIAMALFVGIASIWQMGRISKNLEAVAQHSLQPVTEVAAIHSALDEIEMNVRAHAGTFHLLEKTQDLQAIQTAFDQAGQHIAAFRATGPSSAELNQAKTLEDDLTKLRPVVFQTLLPLSDRFATDPFDQRFNAFAAPLFADAQTTAEDMMAVENTAATTQIGAAHTAYTQAMIGLVALLVIGIAIALLRNGITALT